MIGRPPKLTAEQIATMNTMRWEQHKSTTQIGRKFGVDHTTVTYWTTPGRREKCNIRHRAAYRKARADWDAAGMCAEMRGGESRQG